MLLSHDDILKSEDIKTETVPVPEWGGDVLVRGMTGRQRDRFESSLVVADGGNWSGDGPQLDGRDVRAKIAVMCCVNEDGGLLFQSHEVAALTEKSASALDRIYEVAARLSGLGEKDMKELAEDFGAGAGGGSSSSSRSGSARRSKGSSVRSAAAS